MLVFGHHPVQPDTSTEYMKYSMILYIIIWMVNINTAHIPYINYILYYGPTNVKHGSPLLGGPSHRKQYL